MKRLKTVTGIIYWTLLAVVILFAALVVLSKQQNRLNIRVFHVQSGSMAPTYPVGSMVMVQAQKSYQAGDPITFRLEGGRDNVVTHRIVSVIADPDINKVSYQTKGDANEDPDPETTPATRVLGKVIFSLPYVGYATSFAKTQTGFIVLIVIPATLIVYSEILSIKKEVKKMIRHRKKTKEATSSEVVEKTVPKKVKHKTT